MRFLRGPIEEKPKEETLEEFLKHPFSYRYKKYKNNYGIIHYTNYFRNNEIENVIIIDCYDSAIKSLEILREKNINIDTKIIEELKTSREILFNSL